MPFVIPDIQNITNGTNGYDSQAVPDETDFSIIAASDNGTYVLWGMEVTWSSAFTLSVAAGAYVINQVVYTYSGGTIAVGSASSTDRRDVISINGAGTLTDTQGTACGTSGWTRTSSGLPPIKPAVPANNVALAECTVPASAAALAAICLVDKTYICSEPIGVVTSANTTQATATASASVLTMPLVTGATVEFEANLLVSNGSTGSSGAQVCVVVPAGAGVTYAAVGNAGTYQSCKANITAQTLVPIMTATGTGLIKVNGVVEMGTVSSQTGGMTIGFAGQTGSQSTGHLSCTVYAGSSLVVTPIG